MPAKTNYRIGLMRTRAGKSRDELAAATGRSPKMIERYENGKVDPPGAVLARMATFLDTTVDELLGLPAKLPTEIEVNGRRYVRDPTAAPAEATSVDAGAPFDLPTALAGSAAQASGRAAGKAGPSQPRKQRRRREPPAPGPNE